MPITVIMAESMLFLYKDLLSMRRLRLQYVLAIAFLAATASIATNIEMAFSGERLSLNVYVPDFIASRRPISVDIVAVNQGDNTLTTRPISTDWRNNLKAGWQAIRLEHRGLKADAFHPVPSNEKIIAATSREIRLQLYELKPGEEISWTFPLRQMFRFPDDDAGTYHLHIDIGMYYVEAKTHDLVLREFRVLPPHEHRRTLREVRFQGKFESYLHGELHLAEEKKAISARIDLLAGGEHRRLVASSSHYLSKGEKLLSEGGLELDSAMVGHFKSMEKEQQPDIDRNNLLRVADYEVLTIAWVDDGKLKYTSYGVQMLSGLMGQRMFSDSSTLPAAIRTGPGFEQFCPAKTLPTPVRVKELVRCKSIDALMDREKKDGSDIYRGLLSIDYRAVDGKVYSIRVDEYGNEFKSRTSN